MKFEYDPNKSEINKNKHGIDFDEAQELWLDPHRIEIEARTDGELRKLLIAQLSDETWSLISLGLVPHCLQRKFSKFVYA